MARRRFYAPSEAFKSHLHSVMLEADEARHLREVLRLKPGDEVYVFDGEGKEFQCTIETSRRDSAMLTVVAEVPPARAESPLKLTLAVALLKSDKFDLVVQKATELGVVRIVPVKTKLADIKLKDDSEADKRVKRWRRIALEAAKQSGRALIPEIVAPVSFSKLIEPTSSVVNVLFSERDGQSFAVLREKMTNARALTALVGSEGGWTDTELQDSKASDWIVITLGGRTLRAETAAIAVTTVLQHVFGDLK